MPVAPVSEPTAPPSVDPDAGSTGLPRQGEGQRTHPLTAVIQGALWSVAATAGLLNGVVQGDYGLGFLSGLAAVAGGLVFGLAVGFIRWQFTRFVIDGSELRIDSGVIFRTSRRIPYERLQSVDIVEPFVARLVGLAELNLEMAGGSSSRTTLRFLSLAQARELRRILLSRAHGHGEGIADAEAPRTVIAKVSPDQIIIGTVLSLDFILAVGGAATLIVVGLVVTSFWAIIGGVIPTVVWAGQIIANRVIAQWDFTLTRGPGGLRITRGLLSRSSQTIPFERVQAIAVVEPFIWRRFGWQRLDVDVAGYGKSDDESGVSDTTLLPIAKPELARLVCEELLANSDPDSVEPVRVSPRSWLFAPIGWRYRWVGANQDTFVSREGWIARRTSLVPHHKTQSVAVEQGPIQRWRRVASVEVHTPPGPVAAVGRHLEESTARRIADDQVERARQARARHRPRPARSASADGVLGLERQRPADVAGVEPPVGEGDTFR